MFLDFAKAFHEVPHHRLMMKLKSHGINGKVYNWIQAWLRGRKKRVCLNGCLSSWSVWSDVTSGVSQGSVLGLILFLIFINDIDCGIINQLMKFADDTKIFGTVNTMGDTERLQGDLDSLLMWCRDWQMEFNVGKCGVMHLSRGNGQHRYVLDGQEIQRVSEQKDLTVLIADNLKPSAYYVTVYKQASPSTGDDAAYHYLQEEGESPQSLQDTGAPTGRVLYCCLVYQKDKILIERIQHRFTRMFPKS